LSVGHSDSSSNSAAISSWRVSPQTDGPACGTAEFLGESDVDRGRNRYARQNRYTFAMFHIALFEPEIPPNTGNIARLCAATDSRLHLIGRLGFRLDDKSVRRAGLDYWPHVDWHRHATFEDFLAVMTGRIWAVECPAVQSYAAAEFVDGDCLLFGRESSGLPATIRTMLADRLIGIPLLTDHVRSLNLATAVGIVLFEALRQREKW
jgi:tRNA (cytidine/uridine-2'-O-)-methyltransferase